MKLQWMPPAVESINEESDEKVIQFVFDTGFFPVDFDFLTCLLSKEWEPTQNNF